MIQNIVATSSLPSTMDLEQLSKLPHVIYDPQQFPAAICYSDKLDGASMLVFASGKVIFSGLKSLEMVHLARLVSPSYTRKINS